jgi:hypothetical protein
MKMSVLVVLASAIALGSWSAPASASPLAPRPVAAPSAIENVYYYHGHYYPYRYNGHYYHYRHNGHYYNSRYRRNGHWYYR